MLRTLRAMLRTLRAMLRTVQVKAVKSSIERETKEEFACIAERLRAVEAMKLIQLQSEHDSLGRQVGNYTDVKPFLSRSATGEFNSPPKCVPSSTRTLSHC
eukprot:77648-Prorocentrum_minimum.AAC.2